MRIHADRGVCIGAGNCVLAAEDVFDQDDDGTVEVLTTEPDTEQQARVRTAVAQCPSGALSLAE